MTQGKEFFFIVRELRTPNGSVIPIEKRKKHFGELIDSEPKNGIDWIGIEDIDNESFKVKFVLLP